MMHVKNKILSFLFLIAVLAPLSSGAYAASMGGSISIDPGKEENKEPAKSEEGAEGIEEVRPIEDFSKNLIIRPYLLVPMNFLTISKYNSGSQSHSVAYLPNPSLCAGVGVSWWIIGLSFHAAVAPLRERNVYGKTNFLDFQFNYYFRKFGFDLFYQRYKGYSLENSSHYGLYQGFPGAVRPDLIITTVGANLYYIFSDSFSYDAAFKGTERQNVSGGSFIVMLSVVNFNVDSAYSIIPATKEIFYGVDSGFRSGSFTSIGLSPGYAYTFITRQHIYITPSLCIGSGYMKKSYQTIIGTRDKNGSFIKVNFRLGIGYNGDRWFYGLAFVVDATSTQSVLSSHGISVSNVSGFIETFAGYRI